MDSSSRNRDIFESTAELLGVGSGYVGHMEAAACLGGILILGRRSPPSDKDTRKTRAKKETYPISLIIPLHASSNSTAKINQLQADLDIKPCYIADSGFVVKHAFDPLVNSSLELMVLSCS